MVLVVDDAAPERLLLGKLLGSVGFGVIEVASGEEAIATWSGLRPAAVIMDLHLPGLDGLEATRRIRAIEAEDSGAGMERKGRCAILCISASALEGERERVLQAGGDGFLSKPFRQGALLSWLGEKLGLRYIEEEPEPVLQTPRTFPASASVLAGLRAQGEGWRQRLYAAATGGDAEAVRALAAEAAEQDPRLAAALDGLARGYRFDEIEDWLRTAEDAQA